MPISQKEQVIADITAFKPVISVSGPGYASVFEEVLREHPELLAYIGGYSGTAPLFKPGMEYRVKYENTDVPKNALFFVRSEAEVEDILHKAISRIQSSIIIAAPRTVDVSGSYSSFNVAYNGFYSNLIATEGASWSMRGFDVQFHRYNFKYRIGKVKLLMMEREVDREVERLSRVLFAPSMRPETKAFVAHNYLARNVEYWLKEDANPLEMSYRQSAYGALINKRCVCQGYAEAYKRLLDSQGIVNDVLCGKVKGSAVHHAWNAVSFNGRDYYHVDVTWDSQGGGLSTHRYFCKTDEDMRPTRIWTRRPGVVCASSVDITAIAKEDILYNRAKYIAAGVDKNNF